jgi:predicted transport protein
VSTPEAQLQTQLKNLQARSGRSRDELFAFVQAHPDDKHAALVARCKETFGLGHGDANTLVHLARGSDGGSLAAAAQADGADPTDTWYSGKKAALRPIHDAVLAMVATLGDDIEHAPKKTYVSLRRKKQFAMVGPATATQVEVGLNVKGAPGEGRLEVLPAGGMCSHRVRVATVAEVDAELRGWLSRAYAQA